MCFDMHPVIYHGELPKSNRFNRKQVVELTESDPTDIDQLTVKYPLEEVKVLDDLD